MNKEMTIAEIKKLLIEVGEQYYQTNVDRSCASFEALALYDAGYRKQSDTVKEFIRALKEMVSDPSGWITCKCQGLHYDIDKLAKAYGAEVESSLVVAKDLGIQTIMADDMEAFEKAKKELKGILEVEQ